MTEYNIDKIQLPNGDICHLKGGIITGVKGNAESDYRTGNVNITPANIGAVAKSGDTMTGNLYIERAATPDESIGFGTKAGQNSNYISINQSNWGVMYYSLPVKNASDNTLRSARFRFFEYSPNADGTRSAYAETYRLPIVDVGRTLSIDYDILTTKNVVTVPQGGTGASSPAAARASLEITPANIGAVNKSGDTMTDSLYVTKNSAASVNAQNTTTGATVRLLSDNPRHGIYSMGYYTGSEFVEAPKWMIYRDIDGTVIANGRASSLTDRTLTIGSTGKIFNGTADVSWSLSEIGAVAKSGDTMTGNLYINRVAASDASIRFGTKAGQNSTYISIDQNDWGVMYYVLPVKKVSDGTLRSAQFSFYEYSPNSNGTRSSYAEIYNLPAVDVGRTANGNYNILTTKNAVTIAQGGTGATTAYLGRRNLDASAGIMLSGSYDTEAKIRQELESIGVGETAAIYVSRVPLNLITGRSEQIYPYGTVNRSNTDIFNFNLCELTGKFIWAFQATITSTSISCNTIYKYTGTALT